MLSGIEKNPGTVGFHKLTTLQFAPLVHGWLGHRNKRIWFESRAVCQHVSVRSLPII